MLGTYKLNTTDCKVQMEPRVLASLVSSLLSQALLLLLLHSIPLTPSPSPITPFSARLVPNPLLPALLLHFLSSSHAAAASASASASLLSRKRKRPPFTIAPREDDPEDEGTDATGAVVPRSDPDHFRQCFNMTAATFEWLSGLLDPLLDCQDPAGPALHLPGPARLAIALSRLAAGAPYAELAARFGVPEPAARFCARRLCRVLCTNFRFWIAFPAPLDLVPVSDAYHSLSGGLPNCCGAVACARLGGVATQVVADASSRILSIAAGFRADSSDYRALKCSSLYKDMQESRLLSSSQYLVGCGSYPILPWLMVPFKDTVSGSFEDDFNAVHQMMCRPVLRTVASLKNWGIMSRLMEEEEDAKVVVAFIGTCAILHNVLLMREDYTVLVDATEGDSEISQKYGDVGGFEDCLAENQGLVLRSALAVRAKAIRGSGLVVSQ